MSPSRLRFGLLCNGYECPESCLEIVRSLLTLPGVTLELIVVNQTPAQTASRWSKFKKVLSGKGLLWGLRSRWKGKATEPIHDMSQEWSGIPRIDVIAQHRGRFTQLFSDGDVARIESYQLDFLLKFSFGILRGKVLQAARYGIWAFHHGEPERYRGAPPGFWEVYDGTTVTGAILQKITERLDGGVILQRCYTLTDLTSADKNYRRIERAARHLPQAACKELLAGMMKAVNSNPVITDAPIKKSPSDLQYLGYWLKSRISRMSGRLSYLFTDEQWAIGVVKSPIHAFLDEAFVPKVTWIQAAKLNEFLADPFAITESGKIEVIAEQYDYDRGFGQLVSIPLQADGQAGPATIAIDSGTHLSYPSTFFDGTFWYLAPENIARRSVVIYRREADQAWKEYCQTEIDEPLIDPTLFRHEGLWWILGTTLEDAHGTLKGWFAERINGPWKPHALNPLRVDPRNSRPAGTPFLHQCILYRPTQNSTRTYGGSVVINRVEALTPSEFDETAVGEVHPQTDWPFPHGLHTLSSAGDWTVLDAKRIRWMPQRMMGKLWRRFF